MIPMVKNRLLLGASSILMTILMSTLGVNFAHANEPEDTSSMKAIRALFKGHCLECHDTDTAEGDIDLQTLSPEFGDDRVADVWKRVMEAVAFGEMPPKGESRLDTVDKKALVAWVDSELAKAGHPTDLRKKMLSPDYGNYVDHSTLFDGSVKSAAYTPARFWKRSPDIFDSLIVRGVGLGQGRYGRPSRHLSKVKQPFAIEEKAGIRDYAAITFADSATLATMMRNAEVIVDKHLGGALHKLHVQEHGETPEDQLPKDKRGKPIRIRHPKTPEAFANIILAKGAPTDEQLNSAIKKMFDLVIEREPNTNALRKYRQLIRSCIVDGGNAEGLRVGLIAIAISPHAIYRSELGAGEKDEHGRQMLGAADLAFAISYALTDQKPDVALLDAAQKGRLKTRADVAREVARIWDDPKIDKPRTLRFFREFFGYGNAPKVFKDAERFKGDYRRVPDKLVADADVLVNHIVSEDKDVFVRLLTTDEYFVAHSGDNEKERQNNRELKEFYAYLKETSWKDFPYNTPKAHANRAREISRTFFSHPNGNVVKGWMKYLTRCDDNGVNPVPMQNGRDFLKLYDLNEKTFDFPVEQPFVLAKGKRAGLLMHPAWLLAHSLNLDNDPVRRGKWIRERLLAGTIPELPITVDASIPEDPHRSLRERFSKIRDNHYCWRCHERMNPLGMPFESFDDFGRHRGGVEKLLAKRKTKPVDSTGMLVGTGDVTLDGEVSDPVDMLNRIAKSERARQSFVRYTFRYYLGRNETLEDSSTLIAADNAYVNNGGSFRALVISLLTSDSFLYRKRTDSTGLKK